MLAHRMGLGVVPPLRFLLDKAQHLTEIQRRLMWHMISILQAFTWQLGFGGSFAIPFLLTPLPNLLKP